MVNALQICFVIFKKCTRLMRVGCDFESCPSSVYSKVYCVLCVDVSPAWHKFWREAKNRLVNQSSKTSAGQVLSTNDTIQSRLLLELDKYNTKMMRGFQSTASSRQASSSSGKFMFKPIQVRDGLERIWEIDRKQRLQLRVVCSARNRCGPKSFEWQSCALDSAKRFPTILFSVQNFCTLLR